MAPLDLIGDGNEDGPMGDGAYGDGGEKAVDELIEPSEPVKVSIYVPPAPVASAPMRTETKAAAESSPSAEPVARSSSTETQAREGRPGDPNNSGLAGKPPRGKKAPCEPIDEIVKLQPQLFQVERDIVDYYATHLRELDRQASTATKKRNGEEIGGVLVYLPRCSILKQAGIHNGDIIRSVNGEVITTVAQGIAAYLRMRKGTDISVQITRKNGTDVTLNYVLKY